MSERQESMADIIRDFRERADVAEKQDGCYSREVADAIRRDADRIEKAAGKLKTDCDEWRDEALKLQNREAKLRLTVTKCLEFALALDRESALEKQYRSAGVYRLELMRDLAKTVKGLDGIAFDMVSEETVKWKDWKYETP